MMLELAYRIAARIRASGRQRKLKDMTINLPIDCVAISVIDLACQAISQGEFSTEMSEFDGLLDQVAADPAMAPRMGPAMKKLAERLLPAGF